jgi:imidazolonepropionase
MSDLQVLKDASVIISSGKIVAVGKTGEILRGVDEREFVVIDAVGKAVLPGFVDSHTHFVFSGYREEEFTWRLRGDSYMQIMERGGGIVNTVAATRRASKRELIETGKDRLDAMLAFGVTTVEGKSGYGLDEETEIKQLEVMADLDGMHPVDVVPTFLGAHAIPKEYRDRADAFIDDIIQTVMPAVARRELAVFCDVFCEQNVFSIEQSRKLLSAARTMGFQLKLHADEMVPLGGAELAAELGAVSADHLLHASDTGIEALARTGVVATLLPGTAFSLREPYARGRFMIDHHCAVALATDMNPGSCFTASIPLIVALSVFNMDLTIEEAITALTINGAAALGMADAVGSIDPGKKGDVIILEYPSYKFIPYQIASNTVEQVIKNGVLVYDRQEIRKKAKRYPDADKPQS